MRCRTVLTVFLLAASCNGGEAISPPRPIDASVFTDGGDTADADPSPSGDAAEADAAQPPDAGPPADASVTCARAPLGEWAGVARMGVEGASSHSETRAEIRWKLASSEACIDRYYPTGTVFYSYVACCCDVSVDPGSRPVAPTDGTLTIDRTRHPISYELRGATTWNATVQCPQEPEPAFPVGGPWVLARGTFDGDIISGGFVRDDDETARWSFRRVDVNFPDDGPGCAEPPLEHLWGTGSVSWGSIATLTWTRTMTIECVDTFTPSGMAAAPTENATCSTIVTQPPSAPIAATDGVLRLDRRAHPVVINFQGETTWKGARTCTLPDGEMFIEHGLMGGFWGWSFEAELDGTALSGRTAVRGSDYAWSITRLPPPVEASSPAR